MLTAKGKIKHYRVTEPTQSINMVLSQRVDLIVVTTVGMHERFGKKGLYFSLFKPVYDLYIAMI